MRKLLMWTAALLLSGFLTGVALAEGETAAPAQPAAEGQAQTSQDPAPEVTPPGTVPQAQVDIFNKREEMKQRRDELLQMRAETAQGN